MFAGFSSALVGVILFSVVIYIIKSLKRTFSKVNVMAPLDLVDDNGDLKNPELIDSNLRTLESGHVDGIMVDIWWGIVEKEPKKYNWKGYHKFFKMCRERNLKIIPVMSFHKCGGNVGDTVNISLPEFLNEADPFFVDKFGNVDDEYISPSFDETEINGRTPIQMYADFMAAFASEFRDYIGKEITLVEIGLGPCGELRYPSYQLKYWEFPGSGALQCFDRKMLEQLKRDAPSPEFALPPETGGYNETPETHEFWRNGFQCEHSRFFFNWYSKQLEKHADRVLAKAKEIFQNVHLSAKVAGIHWWTSHASRCGEVAAGLVDYSSDAPYSRFAKKFANHGVGFCFTCLEMTKYEPVLSDPPKLIREVLSQTTQCQIRCEGENALECYDGQSFRRILNWADNGITEFTFLRLTETLVNNARNWRTFQAFVKAMHSPLLRDFYSLVLKFT